MSKEALLEAIEVLGSQAALARACGGRIKQGYVYYWLNESKKGVPPEFCEAIEQATLKKGRPVWKHRLREDVFRPPVDKAQESGGDDGQGQLFQQPA